MPTPKPRSPQPDPAKSRRRKYQWILVGAAMIAASIVSATAGALLAFSLSGTPLLQRNLTPEEAAVFSQDNLVEGGLRLRLPRLTRPVNILVMGTSTLSSDVNNPPPDSQGLGYQPEINSVAGLTDVMLLFRFDPANNKLAILSIPRDTRTLVPHRGMTKINAANVEGGPAMAARVTSDLLDGVGIDRYSIINVEGVQKLIDALGGVDLYVPRDMHYQDDSQHLYINLKKGQQHLNGSEALQFLRFRYDNYGDIGRIQRQQIFFRAIMEQCINPRTIARLPDITHVIQTHVDTNLSMEELLALVGFASNMKRSDVQMLMLPGDFSSYKDYDASYWLPNYPAISKLVSTYLRPEGGGITVTSQNSEQRTSQGLRITIQNGTGQKSTAEDVANALEQGGYRNLSIDSPRAEQLAVTRIIAQNGDRAEAEAVRDVLQVGEVRVENTGALGSDVTIQVGTDWKQKE